MGEVMARATRRWSGEVYLRLSAFICGF